MEDAPFEDQHVPRVQVDWDRSCWWWYPLSRAAHPAMRQLHLALALIAVLIGGVGLDLGQRLFSPTWIAPDWSRIVERGPTFHGGWRSPLLDWGTQIYTAIASMAPFGLRDVAFLAFILLWLALFWGFAGGFIARRAMFELGQRTTAPILESVRILSRRSPSMLWLVGMHVVGIFLFLVPAMVLGWVGRMGAAGAVAGGLLLLLMFPAVFWVGRLVVSALVTFPLGICALGAEEHADAFEGFSRGYAYFFQRPVTIALMALFLLFVGVVGEQLLFVVIHAGWQSLHDAFAFAAGGTPQAATSAYLTAGGWLAVHLVGAYWLSYAWSAASAIYLVLRKDVDGVELDELFSPIDAERRNLPEIPSGPGSSGVAASANAGSDGASADAPEAAEGHKPAANGPADQVSHGQ